MRTLTLLALTLSLTGCGTSDVLQLFNIRPHRGRMENGYYTEKFYYCPFPFYSRVTLARPTVAVKLGRDAAAVGN